MEINSMLLPALIALIIVSLLIGTLALFLLFKHSQKQLTDARIAHDTLLQDSKETILNVQQELGQARERVKQVEELRTEYNQMKLKLEQSVQNNLLLNRQLGESAPKIEELNRIRAERTTLLTQLDECRTQRAQLDAELSAHKEALKAQEEKQSILVNAEKRLSTQFENLATRIFDHKNDQFQTQSRSALDAMISPLKAQLEGFKQQVQHAYETEARERHSLKDQLSQLSELNQKMSKEAINLTKALKGDSQRQGAWGEVVLERVLSESGLREGHEYMTQVVGKNDSGQQIKPDIVVQLPEGKAIVIDSKMSLTAYERFHNAENKIAQKAALADHISSMRNHIRGLGAKDYQSLHGIRSLDYVLMFIPVEPAFLVAINQEPELIKLALDNNIMLVSPTNLLVALRTIHNIWRIEHQNRNSQQIAERAGRIYDKLQSFIEDIKRVGSSINKAQETYGIALNKLCSGKGNLIRQAEQMRKLNVSVKRPIDPELTEAALTATTDDNVTPPVITENTA